MTAARLASIESKNSSELSLERIDEVPHHLNLGTKRLFEGIANIEEESNETTHKNKNELFLKDQAVFLSSKDVSSSIVQITPAKAEPSEMEIKRSLSNVQSSMMSPMALHNFYGQRR